jgi:hypothetical protein
MGFSLRNEWIHEPLEHRIAQARADAQDDWAEELAMGAGAGTGAPHLPEPEDANHAHGLAAQHATGGVPTGARSHSHSPHRRDAA